MIKMSKKLSIAAVIVVAFFLSLSHLSTPVNAQSDTTLVEQMEQFEGYTKPGEQSLEQTIFKSVESHMFSSAMLVGSCTTDDCPASVSDGAIQGMSRMIGMTFHQPADTKTYIADLLQDMNIAQPAYAQGLGFSSLSPLLELWKVMRNIAYLFFVFIFLIIGFAIMFRQKLGGQAAVTVQQALPRIVVALLMVTFSYAIAGLMIDIMYLLMFLLIGIFSQSSLLGPGMAELGGESSILSQNIFDVYGRIITSDFAGESGRVIGTLVDQMLSGSGKSGNWLATTAGIGAGILAALIILFAILFSMFRTFFALAKVYFEIILQIAFSPVTLMMGAIQGNVFGNWVKGLAANLAVFPALLVFVIIGFLFVGSDNSVLAKGISDGGFVPPFLPGRGSSATVGLIVGIGAIMLLPEVPAIMGKFKPKGMFDELGGMAWKNAMRGKKAGLGVATGAVLAPTLGGLGYWQGKKSGKGIQTGLAFGAAGAVGPRRAARLANKTLGQYGEFAENLPGVADDMERSLAKVPGLNRAVNYVRQNRKGGKDLAHIPPRNAAASAQPPQMTIDPQGNIVPASPSPLSQQPLHPDLGETNSTTSSSSGNSGKRNVEP